LARDVIPLTTRGEARCPIAQTVDWIDGEGRRGDVVCMCTRRANSLVTSRRRRRRAVVAELVLVHGSFSMHCSHVARSPSVQHYTVCRSPLQFQALPSAAAGSVVAMQRQPLR